MASSASLKAEIQSHPSDKDIISNLPDEILSHILSFLPTKCAVLTCFLSKIWRYIWTLVPALHLDDLFFDNSPKPNVAFMNFMNGILSFHDLDICIRECNIRCHFEYSSSKFSFWMLHMCAFGVRHLNIYYDCPTPNDVQLSLYGSKTLEVLKVSVSCRVEFPYPSDFKKLRILHLVFVRCLGDSNFENLIRCCPVLEELLICMDEHDSSKNLKVCSSSLKSLQIFTFRVPLSSRYSDNRCSLAIDAPFLECFEINDDISRAYNVSNLSSVTKAYIDVWRINERLELRYDGLRFSIVELLWKICNVKYLAISTFTVASFVYDLSKLPAFGNLIHLEVRISGESWVYLHHFLECTPEVIDLVVEEVNNKNCDLQWHMRDCKLKCLSKLEKIKIKGFKGCQHEMEFARFFLENSIVLKKMTICPYKKGGPKEVEVLAALNKLLSFPRASSVCEVVLS